MDRDILNPTHVTHKKYVAMRALYVENIMAKEVTERFSKSHFSMNAMKRDNHKLVFKLWATS
ncbi:hypothetical protein [Candidatus Kuenenia sp.]|uniref:hypothetical protein n=1 Tax=Candidatus Kuenenia sp. TaxID=2499824 RepID=UPI00322028E6